jgi:hypothetical protein
VTGGVGKTWTVSPGEWRTVPRPVGWKQIRRRILERDGWQCTWTNHTGQRCTEAATEVDHLGDPDDHNLDNLATKCHSHHASKTGHQAAAARWSRVRALRARPQRHPGLVG